MNQEDLPGCEAEFTLDFGAIIVCCFSFVADVLGAVHHSLICVGRTSHWLPLDVSKTSQKPLSAVFCYSVPLVCLCSFIEAFLQIHQLVALLVIP